MSKTGIATGGEAFGLPDMVTLAFLVFAGIGIASVIHDASEAQKQRGHL